jgi:hypothetical protein
MVLYRLGFFYWCWKNSKILILRPLEANGALAHTHTSSGIRKKSLISKIEHDCTLSNKNFILKMKKPKILDLSPCTQKMCSLLPWYTEFPVYSFFSSQQEKRVHTPTFLLSLTYFWILKMFFCNNHWKHCCKFKKHTFFLQISLTNYKKLKPKFLKSQNHYGY